MCPSPLHRDNSNGHIGSGDANGSGIKAKSISPILKAPFPNPSLQVTADHQLKTVNVPVRAPGADGKLVHIKATGICGSDVHCLKTGRIGSPVFEGDCIIGHEAAGIVVRYGEGVQSFKPGNRVAIEPGVPYGVCFLCKGGRYNLCEKVAFSGVYPHEGTLQRYKVHPARWLHRLPDTLSFAEGALQGVRQARIQLGTPVLVLGARPIGLLTLLAARASGASPLVITDVQRSRLDYARTLVP